MKQVAKAVAEKLIQFFEQAAHQRVARELLKLTDKQLEDIGFSRQKLQQGAAAYPWRLDAPKLATVTRVETKAVTTANIPSQTEEPPKAA